MNGGEGRKLLSQDIQLVQNRIEQCLQHYMNKIEVVNALVVQSNIEPCVTELVWERLEDKNQEFFKAYYLKLLVKEQILEFNRLLSEQADLMRRAPLNRITPYLPSNGSHVSPTQHISNTQNVQPVKTENTQQANTSNNCGSAIQPAINGPVHTRKIDVSPNLLLSQNSELSQMINGKSVKTEAGYAGSSPFAFSPPSNYLDPRPLIGDAPVSSFSSVDSNAQHLNDTLMEGDTSAFGFFAHSFPELEADFTTSSDLLESYCGPPFLPTDTNDFVHPHGEVGNLEPGSKSMRFQWFGGD
ncbi:uncharacterized protein LOC121787925 isoform X1 [Salvia splendens]|uniref:uncharacterized protein LOC121787925 isoform X1 n=2 Tax=Salvia splendens TaxID=180675 RepID=UPI001C25A5DA|nr:uncharacterized protein LOC121787925 isoform X1 [Salvia splendens]XP_042042702.1 uncharacterized protein LOC121787925 isoform X1 [Salvia splendens]